MDELTSSFDTSSRLLSPSCKSNGLTLSCSRADLTFLPLSFPPPSGSVPTRSALLPPFSFRLHADDPLSSYPYSAELPTRFTSSSSTSTPRLESTRRSTSPLLLRPRSPSSRLSTPSSSSEFIFVFLSSSHSVWQCLSSRSLACFELRAQLRSISSLPSSRAS